VAAVNYPDQHGVAALNVPRPTFINLRQIIAIHLLLPHAASTYANIADRKSCKPCNPVKLV